MTGVPAAVKAILDTIAKGEAPLGYNQYVFSPLPAPFGDLAKKTVKQILELQAANRRTHFPSGRRVKDGNGKDSWTTAIGRYQVVSNTLKRMVELEVVKMTDPFDANTQDKIGRYLLEKVRRVPELISAGNIAALRTALGNEWESLAKSSNLMAQVVAKAQTAYAARTATRPLAARQARTFPESLLPESWLGVTTGRPVKLSARPSIPQARRAAPVPLPRAAVVPPRVPAASRPRLSPIVRERIAPQVAPVSVPRIRVEPLQIQRPKVVRPALPQDARAPVIIRFANGERLMQNGKSYFRSTPQERWVEVRNQ